MENRPDAALRLEQARIARGFKSAKDAATYFGWPYVTYAQHESGERGITRAAGKYAVSFGVGEGWLLTGEGQGPKEGPSAEPPSPTGAPEPERERRKGQSVSIIPESELVSRGRMMPVFSGAQGGNGKLIISSDPVDRVKLPAALENVSGAYGLYIDGESMIPAFYPGDTALVNPHLRPARGRNVILYHTPPNGQEAEAIIKQLNGWNDREWDLEQWNPPLKFKEFRKEWPICHRVIGKYDAS